MLLSASPPRNIQTQSANIEVNSPLRNRAPHRLRRLVEHVFPYLEHIPTPNLCENFGLFLKKNKKISSTDSFCYRWKRSFAVYRRHAA